jgi:hypothetical protein
MLETIRTLRDRLARVPLQLSEFTALFAVADAGALERQLRSADADPPSAYQRVLGLHDLRFVVFTPGRHNDSAGAAAEVDSRVLLLGCVCDGEVDDVLEGLVEHARSELELVLRHCRGFDRGADLLAYLREHRVRSGHFFRDIGPLSAEEDRATNLGDATISEIEGAFELEERFERFYAAHPLLGSDRTLREDFLRDFGDTGFPLPLTPFERPMAGEARWARRASELMRRMQARAARREGIRGRAAHAKAHALLRATFRVEREIPKRYRIGVFTQPGREFPAWVRSSNGSERRQHDGARDARGLAVSLELDPADLFANELVVPQRGPSARQDFVLFSHPTFFASDLRRFVMLVAIANSRWSRRLLPGLAFAASRAGLREARSLLGALSRRVVHPLEPSFHSGTAYQFGPEHVVKYSAEAADPVRFARLVSHDDPNFLQRALVESLERGPLEVHLYLHAFAVGSFSGRNRALLDLVEDATIDWRKRGAERVHVATLRLEAGAARDSRPEAERATFSPWNALAVHRPLGSLNRARLLAYSDSVAFRQGEPAETREAAAAEPGFSSAPAVERDSIDAAE